MSSYEYLHPAEDVWLVPDGRRECTELWRLMPSVGFELDDDVFVIDRKGRLPIWQSRSIVSAYVFLGEQEIYEEEAHWDRIRLRYLLATLPADLIPLFVDKAAALAGVLRLPMVYRGQAVDAASLMGRLELCAQELREAVGEPGSREVAIAVKTSYPRPG
jgi:hypothetical protein